MMTMEEFLKKSLRIGGGRGGAWICDNSGRYYLRTDGSISNSCDQIGFFEDEIKAAAFLDYCRQLGRPAERIEICEQDNAGDIKFLGYAYIQLQTVVVGSRVVGGEYIQSYIDECPKTYQTALIGGRKWVICDNRIVLPYDFKVDWEMLLKERT